MVKMACSMYAPDAPRFASVAFDAVKSAMATFKKSYDLAIGDYIDKQCQANFMKYVNS